MRKCMNICVSYTHLNIRTNNLHTISGSGSICCCIETRFGMVAWPLCRRFCLKAQSFVTYSASVNGQQ